MFPDAVLIPLLYAGCAFTSICVRDCIKCRNNYVLTQLNKKIQWLPNPPPIFSNVCFTWYPTLTIFEWTILLQTHRMSRAESSLAASNTAASKIVQIVSQFFIPMTSAPVPPHTSFISPCEAEEAWAFEQLVSLFPENARAKTDIIDRVDTLCDKCSYCVTEVHHD